MIDFFNNFSPLEQAFLASLFSWAMTALGATTVFFSTREKGWMMDGALGFAAGIMIAASFWSLLAPAIGMGGRGFIPDWLPALVGFLAGGFTIWLIDQILPHFHPSAPDGQPEGVQTSWKGSTLLVLAVAIHNLPEGLALGVAFGAVAHGLPTATLAGAIALTIGMGFQNIPEGAAVSLSMRADGKSPMNGFQWGQATGAVEVVGALLGAAIVLQVQIILPYALGFAAGTMIYVVMEDLIPEAMRGGNRDVPALGGMIGFALMMVLDTAFV